MNDKKYRLSLRKNLSFDAHVKKFLDKNFTEFGVPRFPIITIFCYAVLSFTVVSLLLPRWHRSSQKLHSNFRVTDMG